ncbi:MAG: C39 family peptidase [Patescibacteria group bacterium]
MKRFTLATLFSVMLLLSTTMLVFAANTFWDIPENAWYAPAVESLQDKNILQGNPDGSYQPDDYVNRAELAVIIERTIQYLEDGEVEEKAPTQLTLSVPFTSQAPYGNWSMPYQEACEEAALIMVNAYLTGVDLGQKNADSEIVELAAWVEEHGYGIDIGAAQAGAVAEDFYSLTATVYTGDEVTTENMKALLSAGYPIIIPVAGNILDNPGYGNPAPPYHMIVIIGFNDQGFITHDPGVSSGDSYVYSYETIQNALHDWTGSKSTVETGERAILVLSD